RVATRAPAEAAISVQTQVGSCPRPARQLLTATATISPQVKVVGALPTASRSANTTGARQPQDAGSPCGPGIRRYGSSSRATSHGPQNPRVKTPTTPRPANADAAGDPSRARRRRGTRQATTRTTPAPAGKDSSQRATPKSSDAEPTAE